MYTIAGDNQYPQTVREFLTLILITFFLAYNLALFIMLLKHGFKPTLQVDVRNVVILYDGSLSVLR